MAVSVTIVILMMLFMRSEVASDLLEQTYQEIFGTGYYESDTMVDKMNSLSSSVEDLIRLFTVEQSIVKSLPVNEVKKNYLDEIDYDINEKSFSNIPKIAQFVNNVYLLNRDVNCFSYKLQQCHCN